MNQRVAVITGAAGGIGSATVDLFRSNGWYVVGLDRHEVTKADRYIHADHAVPDDLHAAFDSMSDIQRIDALVNNAAIHLSNSVVTTSVDEWDLVMATNLRAAFLTTQLVHPKMRGEGGAIVNVSSVHAIATSKATAAYAVSKGALLALTRASALDLALESIRVNAVLPGAVDTPMLLPSATLPDRRAALDRLIDRTPLGRIGTTREMAHAVLFLADTERSAFITGQALVVDGGVTARLSSE